MEIAIAGDEIGLSHHIGRLRRALNNGSEVGAGRGYSCERSLVIVLVWDLTPSAIISPTFACSFALEKCMASLAYGFYDDGLD